ncbi:MAG: lysostaphin resistance A-like protein [Oscillospiraceae bacterium]
MKKIGNFFVAMVPFWIYLGIQFLAGVVLGIVLMVKAVASGENAPDMTSASSLMTVSVVSQIAAFIGGVITMLVSKTKMRDMSPVQQDKKVYGLTVIFTMGAFFVLQLINSLMLSVFGVTEMDSTQELLMQSIPFMFFTALFAAFVEELLFRGLLVTFFKKRGFSDWFTITAITITFALIHSTNMIVYALVFGLVLMGIRYVTGDWKLCVVFHFVGNLMSCLLSVFAPSDEAASTVVIIGSIVGGIIAIITAIFGVKAARANINSESEMPNPELS